MSPAPSHGRIVQSAFRPHPLLANAHLQTLFTMLRPSPRIRMTIERRELPDGDFVDLGWCVPEGGAPKRGPLVLLLHGLTGGFESKYARGLAQRLTAVGWRCVLLQFRGAGPEPNRLPRSYHHGETEDLRELVLELRKREPATPLYAVGWSLGANVLLKYLGECGADTAIGAAVAVAPPFSLRACAHHLDTGFARVYQKHLLAGLKNMLRRKAAVLPPTLDLERAYAVRTFMEWDDAVTAPLHGYAGADDYYARSSCGQFLARIARPTLLLHALDDPFMVPEIVPDAAQLSPHVTLELSAHGGHVGFVGAGAFGRPEFWMERRIDEHLQSLVGATDPATTMPAGAPAPRPGTS